jgi:hypothetical protein
MKKFLFIIPLTPQQFLDPIRETIQKKCFQLLLLQDYANWEALVIGEKLPEIIDNNHKFIHIRYEGIKEEKLQIAVKQIFENDLKVDYIIRLDDDDFFNPKILSKIATLDFDLYTDKYHTFIEHEAQMTAQQIRPWFPNTCVHKYEHAIAIYGTLARPNIKKINEDVRLIANDHSKLHPYYKKKNIIYANRNNPVYLRVLNKESITAKGSVNYISYLKQFGYWKLIKFKNFDFIYSKPSIPLVKFTYTIKQILYNFITQLELKFFYNKILFKK